VKKGLKGKGLINEKNMVRVKEAVEGSHKFGKPKKKKGENFSRNEINLMKEKKKSGS